MVTAKEMNELYKYARSNEGQLEIVLEDVYKAAQEGFDHILKNHLYSDSVILGLNNLGYRVSFLTKNGNKIGTYVFWSNV